MNLQRIKQEKMGELQHIKDQLKTQYRLGKNKWTLNLPIPLCLKPFPKFFILNLVIPIILTFPLFLYLEPFHALYCRPFPLSFTLNICLLFSPSLKLFLLLIFLVLMLYGLSFVVKGWNRILRVKKWVPVNDETECKGWGKSNIYVYGKGKE